MLTHHGGALDVPARASWSPGALPGRLARFGGLPQGEVQRAPLETGLPLLRLTHLFGTLVAQGAVGREAIYGVVDVASGFLRGVRVAFLYQLFDQGDHLRDVLGGARLDIGQPYAEHLQPFVEGVRVAVYDLLPGDTLLVGLVDDLVIYVRDVLNERHVVVPAPQVPGDHIPEQRRPRVTNVNVIVDRRTADVEAEPATLPHLDHLAAHAVFYEQTHAPSLASLPEVSSPWTPQHPRLRRGRPSRVPCSCPLERVSGDAGDSWSLYRSPSPKHAVRQRSYEPPPRPRTHGLPAPRRRARRPRRWNRATPGRTRKGLRVP